MQGIREIQPAGPVRQGQGHTRAVCDEDLLQGKQMDT
jgi:hypothetical protein